VNGGDTRLAITGNVFLQHRVSSYRMPRFLQLVDFLRAADVTFANLEGTVQDGEDWPAFTAGMGWSATYLGGPPGMLEEIRHLGVDAVWAANNHAADFGENGVLTSVKHLRRAGLPFAGIGASLTEAAQPAYVDTPGGLRVATVSAADWGPRGVMDLPFPWPFGVMPSDERPPFRSRPGINLLRYGAVTTVDRPTLAVLRKASAELGWDAAKAKRSAGGERDQPLVGPRVIGWERDSDDELYFMGRRFVAGDRPGSIVQFHEVDVERIQRAVRDARRLADLVVFALHDQSMLGGAPEMRSFAHSVIDAGADVYVNTVGLHGGIEIYQGRLVLYGQPSLWLQNEHVPSVPSSAMALLDLPETASAADYLDTREAAFAATEAAQPKWTSPGIRTARGTAVHVAVFGGDGRLKEVVVQPLEVIPGPRQRSGMPLMPEPGSPVIDEVLGLAKLKAEPFGTRLEMDPATGTARVRVG
jgi:poly-gamma-glutamate capsule biosynthesis protein CapA/YwtB (metallophosphatase superfamily)